ncbi:MAG: O-antigen ligase family protein [Bacteroidales bacterium]|jgi:hypothetical protein|nr:O-antigen ligase family protein [Bacteroidales bacterium]
MKNLKSILPKELTIVDVYDFVTLSAVLGGLLYSYALLSFALVFLAIRVLFIGRIGEKWIKIKQNKNVVLALLSFFALHLIGLLWTENLTGGMTEINHKLPFLVVPIAVLVMSPVRKEIIKSLFWVYVTLLLFGTLWALFHYVSDQNVDTRELIPFANTIRFGINIAFAISLMLIAVFNDLKNMIRVCLLLGLTLWFVSFLFIIQALTGIVVLCILAIVAVVMFLVRKRTKMSYTLAVLLLMCLVIFCFVIRKEYKEYFTPKLMYVKALQPKTALGNYYTHVEDGFIENGCYVNQYVCEEEYIEAFKQRTGITLDDDCGKIPDVLCKDVVKRYLNSKGLTKDAAGVKALTDKDIENIKSGNANWIYAKRFSLMPRLYQTFFEFERYTHDGYFKDASVMQRFELARNALSVVADNPLIGVGTGDNVDKLKAYLDNNSHKSNFDSNDPHNYYLYIMVQFGVLGLVCLFFFLIYPPTKQKIWRSPVFQSLFVITLSAMFVESFFNLFAMMMMYCLVSSLLLFNKDEL